MRPPERLLHCPRLLQSGSGQFQAACCDPIHSAGRAAVFKRRWKSSLVRSPVMYKYHFAPGLETVIHNSFMDVSGICETKSSAMKIYKTGQLFLNHDRLIKQSQERTFHFPEKHGCSDASAPEPLEEGPFSVIGGFLTLQLFCVPESQAQQKDLTNDIPLPEDTFFFCTVPIPDLPAIKPPVFLTLFSSLRPFLFTESSASFGHCLCSALIPYP